MELYLIRHGIAADAEIYTNDEERPLTMEGKQKTAIVARRLYELGLRFDLVLTSPLERSLQTANILKEAGLTPKIETSAMLAPDGEIQDWLDWLSDWQLQNEGKNLALVGHQPNLANWAEILIWGEPDDKLVLKKAGAIGLTVPKMRSPIAQCQLFWLTPPRLLL